MNLETVAISRQTVETHGLTLIMEAMKNQPGDKTRSGRSLLSTIRLIWPQIARLPSVRSLRRRGDSIYCFRPNNTDPVQILMSDGFTQVAYDGSGRLDQDAIITHLKLLYSTYPSGTQYLAGVGVAQLTSGRSYIAGIEINEVSVDFHVHYFSEKASMNVPYKELASLHDSKAEKEFMEELSASNNGDTFNIEIGQNEYKRWREGLPRH